VVAQPAGHLHWGSGGLLVGGCALYLATFGYTRWRMFRAVSWTRLSAAGGCLAVLPFVPWVPGLAVVLALVVITIGLNLAEAAIVSRRQRIAQIRHDTPDADQEPAADGLPVSS
jgi:hypothetical protein